MSIEIAVSGASPAEVTTLVRRFLDKSVPAHIAEVQGELDGQPCRISAIVFMDYIPLGVEVCAFADNEAEGTTILFKHPSQNDHVRFNRIVELLTTFLKSSNLQFANSVKPSGASHLLDDDFSDDDSENDGASWSDRCKFVQVNLESSSAPLRQEALRYLATWAASGPQSHEGLAEIYAKLQLETILSGTTEQVAEMYPVAAALHHLSSGLSSQACDILCQSTLFDILSSMDMSGLPPIVSRELQPALRGLQLWKAYSSRFSTKKPVDGTFGSDSTRCSDNDTAVGHLLDFDDEEEDDDYEEDSVLHKLSRDIDMAGEEVGIPLRAEPQYDVKMLSSMTKTPMPWVEVCSLADGMFGWGAGFES
jgi:hypothetical protein